jgi:uncharacterized protein YchJ
MIILPQDISRCTGETESGVSCHMKQNCKRYLAYKLKDADYVSVITAPECIEHTPLECPLKIIASNEV